MTDQTLKTPQEQADFLLRRDPATADGYTLEPRHGRATEALTARVTQPERWGRGPHGPTYACPDRATTRLLVEDLEAAGFAVALA